MPSYVSHPLVRKNKVEVRAYQKELVEKALKKGNTLVVTPTALGKTVVALLLTVRVLEEPTDKVLFLAPTKPLAMQHQKSFSDLLTLPKKSIRLLTGALPPKQRAQEWEQARIVCATPQTIRNDLAKKRITLKDVRACIFDEAHRAVKDYAYVPIGKTYRKQALRPLVLALTASPGHDRKRIGAVCANLEVENIEVKGREDKDVKPYIAPIAVEWERVVLPEPMKALSGVLNGYIRSQLSILKKMGIAHTASPNFYSYKRLLELQRKVSGMISKRAKKQPSLYGAASKVAALIKVTHAATLLETQGVSPLADYLNRLEKKKSSRADTLLLGDKRVQRVRALAKKLQEKGAEHPKLDHLKDLLHNQFKKNPASRVIVFNHYRDSVKLLKDTLLEVGGVKPTAFVGQAHKQAQKGMSQKEQGETLDAFKEGTFNTMVATSVAEEGLDIPSCDLVVFYEPVPSEIRTIQRTGRTGRKDMGRVVILTAKDTRDEAYYWVAKNKEASMHRAIEGIRKGDKKNTKDGKAEKPTYQRTLHSYRDQKNGVVIYVDHRERESTVIAELERLDVNVVEKQLDVGDYVLSDELIVERKSVPDFLSSLTDGRLFNQLMNMVTAFEQPVLILEGAPEELFTTRNIHRNAIIGALMSIGLKYRVPIFFTSHAIETAQFLAVMAKRAQEQDEKGIKLRIGKPGLTVAEQQRFMVEGLPSIGPTLADNLLKHFGSLQALFNASEKELTEVEKMGPKKARAVHKLLYAGYKEGKKE